MPLPPPFVPAPDGSQIPSLTIYTIGHSNQEAGDFLALLRRHGLRAVVDVRTAPYSRYAPHFSREALAGLLGDAGIRYLWAGDALGGRPDDPACYRNGDVRPGNVDYRAMARQPLYQQGVQDLLETARGQPTVVLCSEEDPRRCHRHRLIERSLREHEVTVLHIRRDGSLEAIAPDETEARTTPYPQLALAGFAA